MTITRNPREAALERVAEAARHWARVPQSHLEDAEDGLFEAVAALDALPAADGGWRPIETQETIAAWAESTFGAGTFEPTFWRVVEEMEEFKTALEPEHILEEAADVVIALYVLAARLGGSLQAGIDRKMAINRKRQWIAHGDGTGHHVKTPPPPVPQSAEGEG